jgi:hypothetical protein
MARIMVLFLMIPFATTLVIAAPPISPDASNSKASSSRAEQGTRGQRLAAYLTGKKFVGGFTMDGSDNRDLKPEEYEIRQCEKMPEEDKFRLTARIKYGDVDQELPLEIKILFAGDTPVITLDSMWIPGMGTFDARVLIRRDRYAGTWKHDAKGGHLFGKIVPVATDDP